MLAHATALKVCGVWDGWKLRGWGNTIEAKTFNRQFQAKDSYFTTSEPVLSAAKTLVDTLDEIATKKEANAGAVPKNPAPLQKFPKHILHFMSTYYNDARLIKNAIIFLSQNEARRGEDV